MSKKKLISMLLVLVMLLGFSTSLYAAQFDYGEGYSDENGYFGFAPFWYDQDDPGGGVPMPIPDPPGGGCGGSEADPPPHD